MLIRGILDEDFVNFRCPSMYIATAYCDFKCDKENGAPYCQNSDLVKQPILNIDDEVLIQRYLKSFTKAIVFAGLEPFLQFDEIYNFIEKFRQVSQDPVVIYTGYNEDEIKEKTNKLAHFGNIIIKFGRFIPNSSKKFDNILGVNLASNNQYAKYIEEENEDVEVGIYNKS